MNTVVQYALFLLCSIFAVVSATGATNCTLVSGNLKYTGCTANVKINWWNIAPYAYTEKDSSIIKGTFKDIVERTLRKCCGDCVQFTYLKSALNSDTVKSKIGSNGSHLTFPIYGDVTTLKFQSYPFFPVIESPGIILIQRVAEKGKSADEVLEAVFAGWPVLVLTLVMAALSGIIMWALDTYWNPEEFPRSFFKGAWEGFWWAFVSMTTVGYGDKAPRSFIARVFAFFWVLIGLVIISIFTATVTTALTAISMNDDTDLFGKRIAVLNMSEEQRFGVKHSAKMVPVDSVEKFVENITSTAAGTTRADGGLIDSYVAGYAKDHLQESKGVRVAKVLEHQFSYGFVVSGSLHNAKLEKCMRRQLSSDESYIVDIIQQTMKALPEPKKSAAEENAGNMFDANSTIFQTAIFACLGIIIFLSLCGLAWEYLYWRPKVARQEKEVGTEPERVVTPHTSYEELVATQCQELDDVMISEVMGFYKVFNKKMEEIRKLHLQQQPVLSNATIQEKIDSGGVSNSAFEK